MLSRKLSCLIVIVTSLMIFTSAGDAATTRAQKREGMPTSATEATSGVDKYLKDLFVFVNENQSPDEELLTGASTHLKGCRVFLKNFTKADVGKYYMLTAWVNYFNGESKTALLAIQRAYKSYYQNPDVRASDTALALLTNSKPSRPPKIEPKPAGDNFLDLDTEALRNDLLERKVTPFQANCLNSTTFNYTPRQGAMCVMFWQLRDDLALDPATDPNGNPVLTDPNGYPTVKPKKPSRGRSYQRPRGGPGMRDEMMMDEMMMDEMMMAPGNMYNNYSSSGSGQPNKPTTFEEEMFCFGELYRETFGNANIKFLAMNTDRIDGLSIVADKLSESNWPWAQAMAKLPQSGGQQFADISVKKPVLAIIDKTGTIKYAGSARGFLPKKILADTAGIDLGSNSPQTDITGQAASLLSQLLQRPSVRQTPPVRQQPPVQPVVPSVSPGPARKKAPRELAFEDEFQAQKLLNTTKDLFLAKKSRRLLTPKRGIELCRQIIKDYPDTKYADEARTLLRENVDPRYRSRYKITDEEMGL